MAHDFFISFFFFKESYPYSTATVTQSTTMNSIYKSASCMKICSDINNTKDNKNNTVYKRNRKPAVNLKRLVVGSAEGNKDSCFLF